MQLQNKILLDKVCSKKVIMGMTMDYFMVGWIDENAWEHNQKFSVLNNLIIQVNCLGHIGIFLSIVEFRELLLHKLLRPTCNVPANLHNLKGTLSGLRKFLITKNPLKMMKNTFYFILKSLFLLKIFKLLFNFLVLQRNELIKKIKFISKFRTAQSMKLTIAIQIFPNFSREVKTTM